MIVIAYVAALFLYLIMAQVAAIPTGAMVEGTTLRESILFIQLTILTVLLIVPLFNKELDPQTRRFALLMVLFLVGYTMLKVSGLADPNIPFNMFWAHVILPLQRSIGH